MSPKIGRVIYYVLVTNGLYISFSYNIIFIILLFNCSGSCGMYTIKYTEGLAFHGGIEAISDKYMDAYRERGWL